MVIKKYIPPDLLTDFVSHLKSIEVDKAQQAHILSTYTEVGLLGYILSFLITKNIVCHADRDSYCFTFADFSKCNQEQRAYYIGRKIYFIKHVESTDTLISNYYKCIKEVIKYITNPF